MANSNVPGFPLLSSLNGGDIVYVVSGGVDYHTTWSVMSAALNYRMNNLEQQNIVSNAVTPIVLYNNDEYDAVVIDYWLDRNGRKRKGNIVIQNNTSLVYLYETGYITIPLDDDCGITFSVINSSGQITLNITSDNSDAETTVLRYYSQYYTGF